MRRNVKQLGLEFNIPYLFEFVKLALLVDQPYWTGIGVYAVELYKLLAPHIEDLKLIYAGAIADDNQFYERKPYLKRTNVWSLRPYVIYYNYKAIMRDSSLDSYLFHYTGTEYYPLKWRNGVITIHDLIKDGLFPSAKLGLRKLMETIDMRRKHSESQRLARRALNIVTISEKAREDLRTRTGLESTAIHHWVIKERFKERDKMQSIKKLNLNPDFNYFLAVSTDRGSKRIDLLKRFSDSLPSKYRMIKIGAPIDSHNTINVGKVDSSVYPHYFNASMAYVHLSDDEGFGWPIVEALGSKIFVICRPTAINKELLGDAAFYIQEGYTSTKIQSFIRNMESEESKEEMRKKMMERMKSFSPEMAAEKYMDVYRRLESKISRVE